MINPRNKNLIKCFSETGGFSTTWQDLWQERQTLMLIHLWWTPSSGCAMFNRTAWVRSWDLRVHIFVLIWKMKMICLSPQGKVVWADEHRGGRGGGGGGGGGEQEDEGGQSWRCCQSEKDQAQSHKMVETDETMVKYLWYNLMNNNTEMTDL